MYSSCIMYNKFILHGLNKVSKILKYKKKTEKNVPGAKFAKSMCSLYLYAIEIRIHRVV